MSIFPTTE